MYLPDGKKSTSWLNERRRRVVRLILKKFQWIGGAPEGIRTPDLCLRRAALYPAELRARRGFMYRRLREAAIARYLKGEGAKAPRAEGQGFESLRARECRECAGTLLPNGLPQSRRNPTTVA